MFLIGLTACRQGNTGSSPEENGPAGAYLGQELPADRPVIFSPGWISTSRNERDFALSPDGKDVYYSYALPAFNVSVIVTVKQDAGRWSGPEAAWFSGQYNDLEPAFTPDGNALFFVSKRPLHEQDSTSDWNIWSVIRKDEGWTGPYPADTSINNEGNEYYPSVAASGNLYFTAENRNGSLGGEDIYLSEFRNGTYTPPVNLGEGVNSPGPEFNAWISPDESYLLFSSWGRADGQGGGDLYISFRDDDGTWLDAVNLGPEINSDKLDYCPSVSPDGHYLFFTSQRLDSAFFRDTRSTLAEIRKMEDHPGNGLGDIYWVSFNPDQWK